MYSLGKLTEQRHGHLFAINSSTGDLSVRGLIDYEQSSVYYLTVVAADRGPSSSQDNGGGGQSSTASVTVGLLIYSRHENQYSTGRGVLGGVTFSLNS